MFTERERKVEKDNLVSIIVPVYNMQHCIRVCLESILKQTYDYYEVIIIDDGSCDDSRNEISYFIKKDNRFHYFYVKNMGVSNARNAGIERAKGDYICFVDPDDVIHIHYIEKLLFTLVRNSCDVTICNFENVQRQKKQTIREKGDVLVEMTYNSGQIMGLFNKYHDSYLMGYVWNKIYSKSAIKNTRFSVNRKYQDMYFNLEIMQKIKKVSIIKDKLYYYNISLESGVHSQSEQIQLFVDWCKMREYELKVFRNLNDTKLLECKVRYTLNSLNNNLIKFDRLGYTKCQKYCEYIKETIVNKYIL